MKIFSRMRIFFKNDISYRIFFFEKMRFFAKKTSRHFPEPLTTWKGRRTKPWEFWYFLKINYFDRKSCCVVAGLIRRGVQARYPLLLLLVFVAEQTGGRHEEGHVPAQQPEEEEKEGGCEFFFKKNII